MAMTPDAGDKALGEAEDWAVLMARAQGGDTQAYHRLLAAILPYLRKIARRRLQNAADVEDAVQDVLLTIHNVRQTYDPGRPFGPWLATIADRRCLDTARKVRRRGGREDELTPAHETSTADPANHYPDGLMTRDIDRALADLPEGQRRAVRMVNIQGMDLAEAARASGQSVGSIKVAIHRALKTLRAQFEDKA